MKLRCVVLDDYQQVAKTMVSWDSLAREVEVVSVSQHFFQERELVVALVDAHIVVLMRERTPFGASLLARLPKLKLLITTGMRNAAIDLSATAAQGVVVCGTGSLSTPPVELTWALILGLARNVAKENQCFRVNGPWQSTVGVDLFGKQLGILGLGKIGSRVAQIGAAFGMRVVAWSQNLTQARAKEVGVQLASSKEELLEASDFVTIHLLLSERTKGLLGFAELSRMRTSAYLINTARAQIVQEPALIEALQNEWIAGAGLDVFETEPLPYDHPFRTMPNVLATPHLGYVSQENYGLYYREVIEDIQAFLQGTPIRRLA